jgi:hypothetical protein
MVWPLVFANIANQCRPLRQLYHTSWEGYPGQPCIPDVSSSFDMWCLVFDVFVGCSRNRNDTTRDGELRFRLDSRPCFLLFQGEQHSFWSASSSTLRTSGSCPPASGGMVTCNAHTLLATGHTSTFSRVFFATTTLYEFVCFLISKCIGFWSQVTLDVVSGFYDTTWLENGTNLPQVVARGD